MGIEKMQTADGGTITIPTGGKKGGKSNKSHRQQQLTCAVVIGSNNAPLYLTQLDGAGRASKACRQLQEVIYNSLDVIEERCTTTRNRPRDGYLGCLAVVGGTAVHAVMNVTKYTIIIATTGGAEDQAIRHVLNNLKRAVVDVVSNPMYEGNVFKSERFEKRVKEIAMEFGRKSE